MYPKVGYKISPLATHSDICLCYKQNPSLPLSPSPTSSSLSLSFSLCQTNVLRGGTHDVSILILEWGISCIPPTSKCHNVWNVASREWENKNIRPNKKTASHAVTNIYAETRCCWNTLSAKPSLKYVHIRCFAAPLFLVWVHWIQSWEIRWLTLYKSCV